MLQTHHSHLQQAPANTLQCLLPHRLLPHLTLSIPATSVLRLIAPTASSTHEAINKALHNKIASNFQKCEVDTRYMQMLGLNMGLMPLDENCAL